MNPMLNRKICEELKKIGLDQTLKYGDWFYRLSCDDPKPFVWTMHNKPSLDILKLPTPCELEAFAIKLGMKAWGEVTSLTVRTICFSEGWEYEAIMVGSTSWEGAETEYSPDKSAALVALIRKLQEMIEVM